MDMNLTGGDDNIEPQGMEGDVGFRFHIMKLKSVMPQKMFNIWFVIDLFYAMSKSSWPAVVTKIHKNTIISVSLSLSLMGN